MRRLLFLVLCCCGSALAQPPGHYQWPPYFLDSFNDQVTGYHPMDQIPNWGPLPTTIHVGDVLFVDVPSRLGDISGSKWVDKAAILQPSPPDGHWGYAGLMSNDSHVPRTSAGGFEAGRWALIAWIRTNGSTPRPGDHFGVFLRVQPSDATQVASGGSRFGLALGTGAAGCVGDAFLQFTSIKNNYFECFDTSAPIKWEEPAKYVLIVEEFFTPNFQGVPCIYNLCGSVYEYFDTGVTNLIGQHCVDETEWFPGVTLAKLKDSRVLVGAVFSPDMKVTVDSVATTPYIYDSSAGAYDETFYRATDRAGE